LEFVGRERSERVGGGGGRGEGDLAE